MVFIDVMVPTREKPQIKSYQNNSTSQTLQIIASYKQIIKEKNFPTFRVQTNFFRRNFSADIFFIDFCMQTIYFTKMRTPLVENNGLSLRTTDALIWVPTRVRTIIMRSSSGLSYCNVYIHLATAMDQNCFVLHSGHS